MKRYMLCFSVFIGFISSVQLIAQGARLIADLNPGPVGSYPSNFTTFAGSLYFGAYTQATGFELFKFDGTNVSLVADINPTVDDIGFGVLEGNDSIPDWFTEMEGVLYFSAFEPRRGAELWSYDGMTATRVSDISPDANDTIKFLPNNSWPQHLTVLDGVLYFSATTRTNPENYELWQFDGTTVRQTADIHPDATGNSSSYPTGLIAFNGGIYFMADNRTNGWELFRYADASLQLIDINPGGPESSSFPKYFTAFGTNLFFQAYNDTTGFELWRTYGIGATLVTDLNPEAASSYPEQLTVYDGQLYFTGSDGSSGAELRRYDGESVTIAAEINPSGDAYPTDLTVFGDLLVFGANDGVHGWELWKFDGATATLVSDLNPAGDAFPKELTVHDGVLYFSATTPETGYELFKYDGETISLVAEVNPGPEDSFPRFLYSYNDQLVFSATEDGSTNWELWAIEAENVPQVPTLTAITRTEETIAIVGNADNAVVVHLETSSDLTTWERIDSATAVDGQVRFEAGMEGGSRFFRLGVE